MISTFTMDDTLLSAQSGLGVDTWSITLASRQSETSNIVCFKRER